MIIKHHTLKHHIIELPNTQACRQERQQELQQQRPDEAHEYNE